MTRQFTKAHALHMDIDTEAALIEELNSVDSAWRESYDSPREAADELLPEWRSQYYYPGDEGYEELNFDE